jgi:N-methylhydantoinase B
VMEAPGSGGYGPPTDRDPALLREDLADGYVSPVAERRDYGIAKLTRG